MPLRISGQSGFDGADAPYFTEEVRRQLIKQFGESSLYDGGLSVRTTLTHFCSRLLTMPLNMGLRHSTDVRAGVGHLTC